MGFLQSKLGKSIFRHSYKDTPRNRYLQVLDNVFLHLHPTRTQASGLRFTFTWGLGGISFLLFLILTVTGVLLMFFYVPDTSRAYDDIKDLEFTVAFGLFMRNLHRWAAHAMVITVWLHMLRVFLTGSYKYPREFNWVMGVVLLVLTLLLSFSGYLLPWDQIAFWAITVGTNMATATPLLGAEGPFSLLDYDSDVRFLLLGSRFVGQTALLRFYVLHCIALPLLLSVFVVVHFWRVRKDRFSAPLVAPAVSLRRLKKGGPKQPRPPSAMVEVWPHLVAREFLCALATMVILTAWSIWVNAPLEELADPNNTPNPAKAPWYFVGLQEMLVYFDPWIAGVMIPTLIILGLMAIPYLDCNPAGVGRYGFRPRRYAISAFLFGYFLWVALILIGEFFRGPGWVWYWPWESQQIPKSVYQKTWDFPPALGLLALAGYVGLGLYLPRKLQPKIFAKVGWGRYTAAMLLLLGVLALPLKMMLRLLFHVHYVLVTPWFRV